MRITPDAVALFMVAEKHRDLYWACIGGGPCQSPAPSRHCDKCREHIDATRELHRALGLKPWEACPLDASSDRRDGTMWSDSLEQARKLRAQLEAAACADSALPNSYLERRS
jgi:hypothetical protein